MICISLVKVEDKDKGSNMKKAVPSNALYEKKLIAEAVERGVKKSGGVTLLNISKVGRSYPFGRDVPGIWVSGPDEQGRYVVAMSVAVLGLMNIPAVISDMRSIIWDEVAAENLAEFVRSIDITVEDLRMAA
jgi:hypothetical protein